MQRRSVWNVWFMVCVAGVVLGACSEDGAEEQQTADTQASDTTDTTEDTTPDCPSGERVDGVCAPLPPAKPETELLNPGVPKHFALGLVTSHRPLISQVESTVRPK